MKFNVVLMFVPVLLTALPGLLCAQTADELDTILDTQEITCSQAALFVLAASGSLSGGGDAFAAAWEQGWLPKGAEADSPVTLGNLSLLIMKAFALPGGLSYTLFPGPRHACRELAYLRIIRGRTDPAGRLSGGEFLHILGRTLTVTGEEEALAEDARRRLLEDVSGSLQDSAKNTRGLSSGAEGLQQYEGEFQLE